MSKDLPSYVFGTAEYERIEAAEQLFDKGTRRVVGALGLGAGADCLEVGAGGGSIARWLCDVVGEDGHVVASDIDVRFLEAIDKPHCLEVRHHDVTRDPLEEGRFDLIHARLVLEHLTERDAVLVKLVRALRPGGWIVVEDVDYVSAVPISELGAAEHAHTQSVRLREFAENGIAHYLGREMPARLRAAGL